VLDRVSDVANFSQALDILTEHFPKMFRAKMKMKKLRQVMSDEMPWRSQVCD
jgi:hypothetical protein